MLREHIAKLRALAWRKAFEVDPALMRGCVRLFDNASQSYARAPDGSAAFTVREALLFLREQRDLC
jgi:hypothetical protein